MYWGEIALLITSALIMIGLFDKITTGLRINNYVTIFMIFVIVLLNVRGEIPLGSYSLSLGGTLSFLIAIILFFRKTECPRGILPILLSLLLNICIVFIYTLHFTETIRLAPSLLATLLSLLSGLWCAISSGRSFTTCLFNSIVGGAIGVFIYYLFFKTSGNFGGNYMFTVMWLSAIFGLLLLRVLDIMSQMIKTPRSDVYFEGGEMKEESKDQVKPRRP